MCVCVCVCVCVGGGGGGTVLTCSQHSYKEKGINRGYSHSYANS